MRKTFLLISILAVSIAASAAVVTPERAMQVAQSFVPVQKTSKKNAQGVAATPTSEIVYTHYMPKSSRPAIYVVNIGNAFAIVSADDVAHPILGYNYSKSWPTDGNIPPQVKAFFDDLAQQIEAASEHPQDTETAAEWRNPSKRKVTKLTKTNNLPDSVGPLLTTTWDQGQYYNALCPEDGQGPDGHVYTGCVATAMAQIINYWGKQGSIHTRGIHSYESDYGTLTVNYDTTTYDFAHMPDALTSGSTQQEVNAVAKLMFHCGVAVNMMYGSQESGAYNEDARAALINFFKVSPDVSFAEKAYFTDDEWSDMLKSDIAAGRPVYYSGNTEQGGGHAFVCNGYKQDGYFYFNFGWSGFSDGWYLTNAVIGFTSNQSALLGVEPDNSSNVILGQTNGTSTFIVEEPLEFYHLMGHNKYIGTNYANLCNNTVIFISSDDSKQLVTDIIEFEDQNISIYDGPNGGELRSLVAGAENNLSPIVSTNDKLKFTYNGCFYNAGFHLAVSQNSDCRMVSNILTSVDTTTIHLKWTENGTATQWEVEYGEEGFLIGNGVRRTLASTSCDITELLKLTHYDIYVRSICGVDEYSSWNKVRVMTGAPYWQDVITTQPESFVYDNDAQIVYISCAEDFVWYANNWQHYKAVFVANIDMGGYKWRPISYANIKIDGNNFLIKNLYINEIFSHTAIFSHLNGIVNNLGIVNAHIKGEGSGTGSLCAELNGDALVTNCYISNSTIEGEDIVGGLVSYNFGTITNCYANVNVSGNRWTGMLTGDSRGNISNCYAIGSIQLRSYCYYAGISAYAAAGTISNCYSIDLPMGVLGYKGQTLISDTSSFYGNGNNWILRTPIAFEGKVENNLINALNEKVIQLNDSTIRTWVVDDLGKNNGLPILSNFFEVTCPNVQDLSVQNSIQNNQNCVIVDWQEVGEATSWEIKYKKDGLPDDSSHIISVNNKPAILDNLSLGHEYLFSVRSVLEDNHSGWVSVKEMVDLPFWTDIVTEQPAGYVEDGDGNVTISSAEGLTWLAVLVNGFHENEAKTYEGKTISLIADIDLQGYRWYPIGRAWFANPAYYTHFDGNFQGNHHTISNMYVNCSEVNLGLFGYASDGASFSNIKLENGLVNSYACHMDDGNYGGLLGLGHEIKGIINCSSNVSVRGTMAVGSLCGWLSDYEGETAEISNCCASGDVYGRESTAGLIGSARGVIIQNCYATGDVHIHEGNWNSWYRGGLVGNLMSNAVVKNCYSTGNVDIDDQSAYVGKVIGCRYMNSIVQNVYGFLDETFPLADFSPDAISDTSSFIVINEQQVLVTPITLSENIYNNLLDVLNVWVAKSNDPTIKTWTTDESGTNGGYPIFGDNYQPTCYNPTNLQISNATIVEDTIIRTRFEWEQIGSPSSWELMYVTPQQSLDSGIIIPLNSNPCELTNLPVGKLLDFYVRAVCGENEKSGWSKSVRFIPDKLYWTDVVTLQPEGYQEDGQGNVFISSADGLAWLAAKMSRLQNNEEYFFPNKISIIEDINLSAYRWMPIGAISNQMVQNFVLDGGGHQISGLYCNENSSNVGLFSRANNCTIKNIFLNNCVVHGLLCVGAIMGVADGTKIANCIVKGEVSGVMDVGGIIGVASAELCNNAFIGSVESRNDVTIPNAYNGYVGGIAGSNNGTIKNNYVVAEIQESPFSGIVAGCGSGVYENLYAHSYLTTLNIVAENSPINSSLFSSEGTSWTLNTPPYIDGAFRTDFVDALNAWVEVNNSEGIYRHWAADTENVNGGFPIFAPIPKYKITFQNDNGNVLQVDSLELGAMPMYHGTTPTNPADAQYTYIFKCWTPEVVAVAGDATYTATYDSIVNTYTITYKDGEQVLQSTEVEYGQIPAYNGATPIKQADAQYTYSFAGWTPEVVSVTGDATYTATFDSLINKYTIVFMNGEQELQSSETEYGLMPAYNGATPVKPSTAQYSYTFANWSPEVIEVTGDATYIATFDTVVNKYTITFKNGDQELQRTEVEYGQVPAYNGNTPTKPADAQYTYSFVGWSPEVEAVSGVATYSAIYNSTVNKYTITWKQDDGSLIGQTTVEYGQMPTHANPSKPATAEFTYTFAGWTPSVVPVTGDTAYTATYTATRNSYTITWKNDDGSTIDQTMVEYGQVPTHSDPTKVATAQYTYTFAGWSPEVVSVTGDAIYIATFDSVVNKYTITFMNGEQELQRTEVEYGQLPAYNGATPTKQADAQYTYSFVGWTPEVVAVTGAVTYTATFNSTVNSYTITWKNDDGSTIDQTNIEYGQMPTHADVVKESTAQYTYTFAGWTPTIVAVTGEATYTATFNATTRKYLVTFLDVDGTVLQSDSVEYGAIPYCRDPEREADDEQYAYTFAGWTPEVVAVTGDATYTAAYTSTLRKYLITFLDEDGTVLSAQEWEYGSMPSCTEPTKADDEQYAYTFAGWTPEVVAVVGEATYTASYTATKKPEGFEDVIGETAPQKVMIDGTIFILRGDRMYTLTGQEVR